MKMKEYLFFAAMSVSALLPLQSGEWRDAARGQRERADRLRERGLRVCRRHEFLDGGIFRRKNIFRKNFPNRDFRWCTVTNTFNGEIVNAAFAGTGLRILRSFRWQDGVKRSETWLFDEKGMWSGREEVSNVCFSALYYLNGNTRQTETTFDTERGPAYRGRIYRFDMNLRDATVLGLVGAGGIGAPLIFAMSSYRWNEVGAILLGLIVLVLIIEWISSRIRVKLARG